MCVKPDYKGMKMKASKRQALEKAGWKVSSTDEFLGLSKEESAYIEMKLSLAEALRKQRLKKHLSQVDLAALIASSQSRVAKMESGDSSVSMDLLIKSLLALGTTKKALASAIVDAA
jgi:ribosome-binding protein aMBF1 (putative translation factor)